MKIRQNIVVSKRLMVINSASSVISKLLNATVLLWSYQYLLRRIPPEEFSILPVVMAVMVFAPLFFSFFTGGISRHVVEAYARDDFEGVTRVVSSIVPLLAAGTLIFLAVGLPFSFNIEDVLNVAPQMVDEAHLMVAMLVISFSGQMLASPWVTGFHVRQRFVELNLLGVGRDLARMCLMLVLLLAFGPQVILVVTATVIAEGLHSVVIFVRGRQMVREIRFRPAFYDGRQARALVSFGMWTTVGRLGSVMYINAATIVLNILGSPVDVTAYHIGSTIFRQVETLIGLAALPLQPVMTAMHAREERARLASVVLRGGRYALWVAMAVATPLIVYADAFIMLYVGPQFWQAAVVIILFMVTFTFTKPTQLLSMMAMAIGRVREFFLPAFLFQLLGLGLMLLFVSFTEADAIAVTLSLTVTVVASQLLFFWGLCLRLTNVPSSEFILRVLLPGHLPAVASAAIWVILKLAVRPESWGALLACVSAGGLAYLFALFRFGLSAAEKHDVGLAMGKIRRRLG